MLRPYERSLQPGLVGAGRIVPVAGLTGPEILILHQQLNIQRRQSPQRLNFSALDRLIFAGLYRLAPSVLGALLQRHAHPFVVEQGCTDPACRRESLKLCLPSALGELHHQYARI